MARVQVPGPCRRRRWSKLGYVSIEKEPFGPPWFPCQPVAPSGVGRGGRGWCWLWSALTGVTPAESPLAGSSWAGLGIQCGTRPGTWEFPGQGRCTSCREQGPEQSEGFKNKIKVPGVSRHLGSQRSEHLKGARKRLQAASLAGRTALPQPQDAPSRPTFTIDTALTCLPG